MRHVNQWLWNIFNNAILPCFCSNHTYFARRRPERQQKRKQWHHRTLLTSCTVSFQVYFVSWLFVVLEKTSLYNVWILTILLICNLRTKDNRRPERTRSSHLNMHIPRHIWQEFARQYPNLTCFRVNWEWYRNKHHECPQGEKICSIHTGEDISFNYVFLVSLFSLIFSKFSNVHLYS